MPQPLVRQLCTCLAAAAIVVGASACPGTLDTDEVQLHKVSYGDGQGIPSIVPPGAADAGTDAAPSSPPPAEQFTPDAAPAPDTAPPPPKNTCTSNADCKKIGLDSCNGKHKCIKGGKQGDECEDAKIDCRDGYYCCPLLNKCYERCTSGNQCPDTGKKCIDLFGNKLCIG